MKIYEAIILGAIQGFAEFLPISSSGHLLLAQRIFGINEGGLLFDVLLHVGTLVPIFIVFFKDILGLFKKPFKTLLYLVLATIPCMITGLLLQDTIEGVFYKGNLLSAILLACTFLLTAGLMWFSSYKSKNQTARPLNAKKSLIMGAFQAVALMPGLSRSGTVLTGGVVCVLDREQNAKFVFLMSIPVILGAAVISGAKAVSANETIELLPTLIGMLTSAITGYIAVNTMLKIVKKANFKVFSYYLILVAVLSVVLNVAFGV